MEAKSKITKIEDIIAAAEAAAKSFGESCWFRGHSRATWEVETSVHRESPGYSRIREKNLLDLFKLQAPSRHADCPDPKDLIPWLTLARHFGLDTRLLDWSRSPIIAAYFCIEEPNDDDRDGDLWALSPSELNAETSEQPRGVFLPRSTEVVAVAHAQIRMRNHKWNRAVAFQPTEIDARMLLQQSAFTVHSISTLLNQMPTAEHWLMRFTIPSAAKETLRTELSSAGIRRFTLFPDLANLARDLNTLRWPDPVDVRPAE